MRLFSDHTSRIHDPWLRHAATLAERGRGCTAPNPIVGCVLVRDDEVVGEGYHARAGEPHAEALALRQAGERARGSHAYVTLEPCAHHGKTPPCADALIAAGVSAVTIGMRDPNPTAEGGAQRMLRAGVEVRFDPDPSPFQEQLQEWATWIERGTPWVRLKMALSLDGHSSTQPSMRSAISGAEASNMTMRLRAASDAVLVGAATADIDDPMLTVRPHDDGVCQPLRVVLCRQRSPREDLSVFRPGGSGALLLVSDECGIQENEIPEAEVDTYRANEGLRGALAVLGNRGITSVLVEAGPRLFTSFWRDDLIDELVLYHAGGVTGPQAPAIFGHDGGESADLNVSMRAIEAGVVGGDAVTVWRRRERTATSEA